VSHDTDKLIRQLSLVAFLMAERRPITARDVKGSVEGYQEMSDEAFARRFYSDRAELLALGVPLDSRSGDVEAAAARQAKLQRGERLVAIVPKAVFGGDANDRLGIRRELYVDFLPVDGIPRAQRSGTACETPSPGNQQREQHSAGMRGGRHEISDCNYGIGSGKSTGTPCFVRAQRFLAERFRG